MQFYVDIREGAKRFVGKLDHSIQIQVEEAIKNLGTNPMSQGKPLGSTNSGVPFYEKRIMAGGGIRIYFSVLVGRVIVDEIIFDGRVPLYRIGNKKSQQRDIQSTRVNN